ncbi:hypothetical protein [Pedobacter sp. GR22-6]|uniref:hypothetical protein n=1 Tax=Pedobacter sp. GR22-6 TaxID=3127957 RepID=UPI00307D0A60
MASWSMENRDISIALGQLQIEVIDLKNYSLLNTDRIIGILSDYRSLLSRLNVLHPLAYDNLFDIGLGEISDHLALMQSVCTVEGKQLTFNDLQFYLSESIADAREKLAALG